MRLLRLLFGVLLLAVSSTGYSATTFFTDSAAFDNATSTALIEDFESVTSKNTALASFVSNGITYTGLAGTPFSNVYVSTPGFTNFGVPLTGSSILTANGDEDFTLDFSTSITAIGFDTYLNGLGPANIYVFGVNGLLDSFSLIHNPESIGFLGISSTENITSLRWTTTGGASINTGIDNIRTGSITVVPIPAAAWLLGSGLIGLIGIRNKASKVSTLSV